MKYIGHYRICGLLGRGGMGKVLKVEVPVIRRILALKLLAPGELLSQLMGRATLERLFTDEAKVMAGIRHPNIIAVFDYGHHQGSPFYVMDYYGNNLGAVIGETYRTEAPSRPLLVAKVAHYTQQMLAGLDRLHSAGIVHRDMKPFNVLLTEDDTVKLCDFGLSKLRGERLDVPPTLKVGSPFYAPPEQEANPDRVDRTADLYAVGVMVYRMLTGKLPRHPIEPASRLNPQLSPEWDAFLARSLSRQPSGRYPDALTMADELMALQRQWEDNRDAACRLFIPLDESPAQPPPASNRAPRAKPLRTGTGDARSIFALNTLWQPKRYHESRFESMADGRSLLDVASGLQWQYGGSAYPLDWREAVDYVKSLNAREWEGHHDWRLPTVAELITLLRPPPAGTDFCLTPEFASHQKRLWSIDRRTFTSAWYVSLELGFVAWQDRSFANHVKAVRST
jgi:serine/threonine-protein kinase